MTILDGKKVYEEKIIELKKEFNYFTRKPSIVVIQVGNDESSNIYIRSKERAALTLECNFECIKFDVNTKEDIIISKINKLNNDNNVDGIIVQLPLPKELNSNKIINSISSEKDIDGLTDVNSGLLISNKDAFIPCTPLGIMEILKYYNISVKGKHVVIIGRSKLVGKPLISLMLNGDATVTICHSYTNNLTEITKTADILITAIGKKGFINGNMIKPGAVLIDAGISKEDNKIYGDIDFDSVDGIASYITPVPGGVGQMTVLCLYKNLLKAYNKNNLKNGSN